MWTGYEEEGEGSVRGPWLRSSVLGRSRTEVQCCLERGVATAEPTTKELIAIGPSRVRESEAGGEGVRLRLESV